ncbi:MAG TPA: hypothetical protein VK508_08000 [Cyclobacteriaceae bacterium]|nr:hypothetical protein [Cyclobacteriaceae bacterium]
MKDLHEDDMFASVRERLGRYEEAPSKEVWRRIAAVPGAKERMWPVWVEGISLLGMAVMLFFGLGTKQVVFVEKQVLVEQEARPAVEGTPEVIENENRALIPPVFKKQSTKQSFSEITIAGIDTDAPSPPAAVQQQPEQQQQEQQPDSSRNIIIEDVIATITPPYKKPKSKFEFYLAVTPSLSFQKMIPDSNDAMIVQGFAHRSPLSMARFGLGVDGGFQRDINHILGFYGGVSFYRQRQQLTYFYYDKDADVERVGDPWTFEITRSQHTKTFAYSMTNIGVRSGLLITLKGDKLKHKVGAGLLFSQGFAKEEGSYNNSRSGYLAYQLFYRNEVRINEHFKWFIEPTFIYAFISKEKMTEPFRLNPYRTGITAGVLYRF